MLGCFHNLDRLSVFMTVVEMKSVSRAAEHLLLTQPCVSRHIKVLEDDLGVRLLDRGQKSTVPTEAGRLVYDYAKRLRSSLEELQAGISALRHADVGTVAIGTIMTIGNYLLPPVLSGFKLKNPGAEILLRISDADVIHQLVRSGEVHVGLTPGRHAPDDLGAEVLCSDKLVLVAAPSHALARYRAITLEQLAEQDFILPTPVGSTAKLVTQRLNEVGISPRVTMWLEAPEAVKRVVEAGLGVTILYRISVVREIAAGTLREVKISGFDPWDTYNMIYNPRAYQSPILHLFFDFLRRETPVLLRAVPVRHN